MNALGLRSIFIAASVHPITVHSLILPTNIKIQRSGSEFLDDPHVIQPAADLERSRLGQGFCLRSDSGGCGARAQRGGGTLRWSGRGGALDLCASVPPAAQRSS